MDHAVRVIINSWMIVQTTKKMNEQILMQQEEAKALVRQALEEDTRCRNNDLWLCLYIWQKKQQIRLFVPYEQLTQMMPPETISRARREIQNTQGALLPTDPQILVRRRVKEDVLRAYFAENVALIQEYERIKFGIA